MLCPSLMETPKTVCSGTTLAQPPQTSQTTHLKSLHHCPFLELTHNTIAQKPWQEPSPRETTDNIQFRGLLTFLTICKILLFFPGAAYPAAHHWRVTDCGGTWSRHLWSCPGSQHTGRHPPRNLDVSVLPEITHSVSAVTSVLVILGKTAPSPHRFLPVMRQGMLLHRPLMPPEQVPEHGQNHWYRKRKILKQIGIRFLVSLPLPSKSRPWWESGPLYHSRLGKHYTIHL